MKNVSWFYIYLSFVPLVAYGEKTIDGDRFSYQGCIKAPNSMEIADITYYPSGDPGGGSDGFSGSLFLASSGSGGPQQAMEMSIPVPSIEGSSGDCPTASTLRSLTNISCNLDDGMVNDVVTGGIAYYNDEGGVGEKLYWTAYEYYNVQSVDHDSAGRMNVDLTNCEGAWGMTGPGGLNTDGNSWPYHSMQWEDYVFEIHDKDWADTHLGGRYLIYGKHREAGARGSSTGIQLYAAAPWDDGDPIPNNGDMAGQIMLSYSGTWDLPNSHYFPAMFGDTEYRPTDRYSGGAWVRSGTEDAIVITGRKGIGDDWYGNGGSGCNAYQGYHDDPYANRWWFYDPTDLECSIAGTCDTWDPVPYAIYDPSGELFQDRCFNDIEWQGGASFDNANDVFFFAENVWTGSGFDPIIHVYRVNGGNGGNEDYTLTVAKTGGGLGTVTGSPNGIHCGTDCSETYDEGTQVQLTATPDVGSVFAGWSGHADCADGQVTMNNTRTCNATFNLIPPAQVTLSVSKNGSGSGTVISSPVGIDCGSDCSENFDFGLVVGLSALPNAGSQFNGWSGNSDCSDGTLTMEGNAACIATFSIEGTEEASFCPSYEISPLFRSRTRQVQASPSNWISVIESAQPGDEVLLADGTYSLDQYAVQVREEITIRSASGNRESVLIEGQGYGIPSEGFMVMSPNVTLADLSMTAMRNHAISIKGENGAHAIQIYNVHLYDVGTQHIKGTPSSQDGVIACSKIGYTPGGVRGDYINAIGIHGATDYVIRDNEIYNIWGDGSGCEVDLDCGTYQPGGGPSIHIWNNASGNIIERNRILDSFRGPALGFGTDHVGGAVRNNFIFQSNAQQNGVSGDAGISIQGSNMEIDHNTVILATDYRGAIEIQDSSNLQIRNNLLTKPVWNRGNSTYNAQGNKDDATAADLIAPGNPNLDPNSNAIDYPSTVNLPGLDDIDGDTRPQGPKYDAGCNEVNDGSPPTIQHTLLVTKAGDGAGTVASSPAGIHCGNDCSEDYEEGMVVTLTPTPDAGSAFIGWWGPNDCLDGEVTVDADKACRATFSIVEPPLEQFTLAVWKTGNGDGAVISAPAGIDCGGDCQETFSEGTIVNLTPVPSAGSEFSAWSGAADCADGQITISDDVDCTAEFSEEVTPFPESWGLTVQRRGNGSGVVYSSVGSMDCGLYCSQDYDEGTVVSLIATPDNGSEFSGWSGHSDCNDGSVSMVGDRTCEALFTFSGPMEPGLLSVAMMGGSENAQGSVTSLPNGIDCGVDCDENFDGGDLVRLEAVPEPGWAFGGWFGPSVCRETIEGAQQEVSIVQIHRDISCTAVFVLPGKQVIQALSFESSDAGLERPLD